jgi:4-amino-4-deoxy-L-arabinose transferase-like glycosyltransferase
MSLKNIGFAIGFIVLILISFGVKLIEFDNPYSGFHLLRQLDNLVAIENYFLEGIELKRRLVGGSYIVLELPIYQALVAFLSSSIDGILFVARSVNLVFAFLSMILIFKIANIWFDMKTAIYSTLFFSFSPLNLAYHRSIMMDITAIFFCLVATWMLIEYFTDNNKLWHLPLFVIAGGLSVVMKPLYFFPVGAIALANFIAQYRSPFSTNFSNYIKKNLGLILSFITIVVIMFWWMGVVKSANEFKNGGLMAFMSDWSFLTSPKYYVSLVFRLILLILNPFTFVLFITGILLVWKRFRDRDTIALPILIPLYFIFFGQINAPHEYYSLIMVPYCSIVAGVGAAWLEEVLISGNLIGTREWTRGIFCVLSSIVSVLIFFLNFLVGSPNVDQKTVQIEQEMSPILEPRQVSKVYINKPNFPLNDYIKYNRLSYLSYALGVKSEEDIRTYGRPITEREMLYALRQYGNVILTQDGIPKNDIELLRQDHPKKLRYYMFYRYFEDQRSQIKTSMGKYKTLYESNDWIVYDLNIQKYERPKLG